MKWRSSTTSPWRSLRGTHLSVQIYLHGHLLLVRSLHISWRSLHISVALPSRLRGARQRHLRGARQRHLRGAPFTSPWRSPTTSPWRSPKTSPWRSLHGTPLSVALPYPWHSLFRAILSPWPSSHLRGALRADHS